MKASNVEHANTKHACIDSWRVVGSRAVRRDRPLSTAVQCTTRLQQAALPPPLGPLKPFLAYSSRSSHRYQSRSPSTHTPLAVSCCSASLSSPLAASSPPAWRDVGQLCLGSAGRSLRDGGGRASRVAVEAALVTGEASRGGATAEKQSAAPTMAASSSRHCHSGQTKKGTARGARTQRRTPTQRRRSREKPAQPASHAQFAFRGFLSPDCDVRLRLSLTEQSVRLPAGAAPAGLLSLSARSSAPPPVLVLSAVCPLFARCRRFPFVVGCCHSGRPPSASRRGQSGEEGAAGSCHDSRQEQSAGAAAGHTGGRRGVEGPYCSSNSRWTVGR